MHATPTQIRAGNRRYAGYVLSGGEYRLGTLPPLSLCSSAHGVRGEWDAPTGHEIFRHADVPLGSP